MTTARTEETQFDVRRRQLAAGEARAAVFRRVYDADIDDVWDACTNPERLRRWYAPVEGDLRLGGAFTQGDFGSGVIVACEPPRLLRVALGGNDPASDEIELRLESAADGTTVLEFEHATMRGDQEVGGQIYDAVYCMGGGYPPRLVTLDQHLRGTLRPDVEVRALHLDPEYAEAIQSGMASLVPLIEKDKQAHAS